MKDRTKRHVRWFRPNYFGLLVGLSFFCFALTPSLLPVPPFYQGLVTGISFALGYLLGVTLSWLWRKTLRLEPPSWAKEAAWTVMLIGLPVTVLVYIVWAAGWQNDVRELVDLEPLEGYHFVTIISTAAATALILFLLGRTIMWLIKKFSAFASRWVPAGIGAVVGVAATLSLLILIYNGVLEKTFVTVTNNFYRDANSQTDPGIIQPQNSERTGSPSSLVKWDTLGRQGRSFVAGGPSVQQLTEFNGEEAAQGIRVYVGVQSAETAEERARLALQELERTGAFNREVLAVVTATGTGWVEPRSADSLEYIWNGDTAIAAIQYSYLPSWVSFLVDRQHAVDAGRALFNAVYERWEQLPENDRPQLLAYGLSLGSYGAQSAFSGVDDLQNRTDGALFIGGPSFSQPWGYFTEGRDNGSPQWQPVYQNGNAVRFAAKTSDLNKPDTPWSKPRTVYLQHASDSVVWWNLDLILNEPDWLKEPRGPGVSPLMSWYPFVTFAQVTVNQFFAADMPPGHGHNYSDSIIGAWTAIAEPQNWSGQKDAALQTIIDAYPQD